MRTSKEGLRLITQREGKILHVYLDSKKLPTVGVGHLLSAAERRAMPVGTKITQEQCDAYLTADLKECEDAVNGLGVKLSQNEFDALVSLAFNIGVGGFNRSTVARRLKAGDHKGAAEAILLWNKPKEIQGRRRGEYHQFKTAYTGSAAASTKSDVQDVNKPLQGGTGQDTPATTTQQSPPIPPAEAVSVPPVQTEPAEGIISTVKGWYAAAPAAIGSALAGIWAWLQGAATDIIIAFFVAAAVIAIVWMVATMLLKNRREARAYEAAEKQKERDFELTKLQLQSAMDPNKQTVLLAPPPTIVDAPPSPAEVND